MEASPNIALSFAAGLLSFLSPCILPLIPSYISFIGGASLEELKEGATNRWVVLKRTLFFVLGFGTVFVGLGIILSGSSILLGGWNLVINIIAGAVVMLLGLNFIFDFWKILNIEKRFHVKRRPTGVVGSFLVGMAFGGGWSPCIGPILAAILFLASQSGQLAVSVVYLVVYSAGLGVPFILAAVFFTTFTGNVSRITRHAKTIKLVSGFLLIGIGLLIALGRFQQMNTFFFSAAYELDTWSQANGSLSRLVFGAVILGIGLTFSIPFLRKVVSTRGAAHPPDETSHSEERTARPFPVVMTSIAGIFVILALLQFAAVIQVEGLVTAWLTFQGL